MTRWIARIAWLLPLFFLGIALHQGRVAYDLQTTKTQGTEATAEVQDVKVSNRTQVTYDYVGCETSWILDTNERLLNMIDKIGATQDKEYALFEAPTSNAMVRAGLKER